MKKSSFKLRQEVKVKVDIVTSDDIKIYYTGKLQDFTARYIMKDFIKRVLKNGIKRAFGELNIILQDEFNKNFITTVNECQILFITYR